MTSLFVATLAVACGAPATKPPAPAASAIPQGALPEIDRTTPLPNPLPDIVARVNGEPVRIHQVLGLAKKALRDSKDRSNDMPGAVRQALREVIDRELLFQEAMARGVTADTKRVEAVYDQVRGGFPDEPRFVASLADQGLDPDTYKRELRVQETVNALLALEGSKVEVSDDDARAYWSANPRAVDPGEKLELRHVFIRLAPDAPARKKDALRVKAGLAAHRAAAGEDFAKLVKEYSDDTTTRDLGGRVDIRRGMMPAGFDQAAYALAPGQVSSVVETPLGFYVIKLEERVPGPPASFEEVRDVIKAGLGSERRAAVYQTLLTSLRAKARIETYL